MPDTTNKNELRRKVKEFEKIKIKDETYCEVLNVLRSDIDGIDELRKEDPSVITDIKRIKNISINRTVPMNLKIWPRLTSTPKPKERVN